MAENHRPNLGSEIDNIIVQHGIFALLVDTLNKQIQVKYQSMPTSPYDTHDNVMSAFLATLFIYATASVAEIMLRTQESTYHRLVGNIRFLFSAIATILLLVILAPVLGFIFSVLWTCLFVTLAYESCQELYQLLSQTSDKVLNALKMLFESVRNHKDEPSKQMLNDCL